MSRAVYIQTVKGACLNQTFYSLLVDLTDFYVIDELENILRLSLFFSRLDDSVNGAFAHVFHAQKPEADFSVHYRKLLLAVMNGRRQHFDAHLLAVSDIFCDGFGVSHDAGHQRRHKFHRIVFLQISSLVSDYRIYRRVGFIECVLGKGFHIGKDGLCRRFADSISDAARNFHIACFVQLSMDEIFLLLQHDIFFLFTHSAAYDVRTSKAVAGKVPHDLHNLLLINKTSVGYVQNRRQFRRHIFDFFRILLILNVFRNGIHRTRSVQGNSRYDIFKAGRLQVFHKLGHTAAFQLKNTQRIAAGNHIVNGFIIVAHPGKVDGQPVVFLNEF